MQTLARLELLGSCRLAGYASFKGIPDIPIGASVRFEFSGEVIHWRGPSPFHFVRLPEDQAEEIRSISSAVTYGWGMIPVQAIVGSTSWATSLFPKDGGYLLPLRDFVRKNEQLDVGVEVHAILEI